MIPLTFRYDGYIDWPILSEEEKPVSVYTSSTHKWGLDKLFFGDKNFDMRINVLKLCKKSARYSSHFMHNFDAFLIKRFLLNIGYFFLLNMVRISGIIAKKALNCTEIN